MTGSGLPRFPHPVYPVHPCKYLPLSGGGRGEDVPSLAPRLNAES